MNNVHDETGPSEGPRRALRSAAAGRVYGNHSGYQNLGEGSEDSATSKKLEMNLRGTGLAAANAGGGFSERLHAARRWGRDG